MKEPILSREEVERAWDTSNGMVRRDNVSEDQLVAFAAALESAILDKLCGEPIYQCMCTDGDTDEHSQHGRDLWMDVSKQAFDSLTKRSDVRSRIVYALNRSKA